MVHLADHVKKKGGFGPKQKPESRGVENGREITRTQVRARGSSVPGGEGKVKDILSVIESFLDVARNTVLAKVSAQGLNQCKPRLETLSHICLGEVGGSRSVEVSNLGLDSTNKNVPVLTLMIIREDDIHVVLRELRATSVLDLDVLRGRPRLFKAGGKVVKMEKSDAVGHGKRGRRKLETVGMHQGKRNQESERNSRMG